MLHKDASRHVWLVVQTPPLDVVVTMDDATNEIYAAILGAEKGTEQTLLLLLELCGRHGLPLSLYTNQDSYYFHVPVGGGRDDRGTPTQVDRALTQRD